MAIAETHEQAIFAAVTSVFEETCRELGLTVFTIEADRHGSIVWEAGEAHEGQRYVTVALSSFDERDIPLGLGSGYLVETWAGASDGTSFTRKVTYRTSLLAPLTYPAIFAHTLKPAIADTKGIARTLNPGDPDELDLPDANTIAAQDISAMLSSADQNAPRSIVRDSIARAEIENVVGALERSPEVYQLAVGLDLLRGTKVEAALKYRIYSTLAKITLPDRQERLQEALEQIRRIAGE